MRRLRFLIIFALLFLTGCAGEQVSYSPQERLGTYPSPAIQQSPTPKIVDVELKMDALTYATKKELDRAISYYTKAIEINPRDAEAYYNRALAYHNKPFKDMYGTRLYTTPEEHKLMDTTFKDAHDHAISDYTKAIEINPRYIEAYVNRGVAYCSESKLDLAIADFNRALEINPRDAKAYYSRGLAYFYKREAELAIADYDEALKINPGLAGEADYRKHISYIPEGPFKGTFFNAIKIVLGPRYTYYENLKNRGTHPSSVATQPSTLATTPVSPQAPQEPYPLSGQGWGHKESEGNQAPQESYPLSPELVDLLVKEGLKEILALSPEERMKSQQGFYPFSPELVDELVKDVLKEALVALSPEERMKSQPSPTTTPVSPQTPWESYPSPTIQQSPTPKIIDVELKTVPAVSSEERMKSYPSSGEYIAFSLKVAKKRILSTPKGKDYRELYPEVFTLGGITAIKGLVYDRKTGDVILVGARNQERAILTLDDFAVALRARFIHGKWPLVSIDPTEETKKTQMQRVWFEGGVENTEFGRDILHSYCQLMQLAKGIVPSRVEGVKSYRELFMEETKKYSGGSYIISNFWFYPVLPELWVREDVVAIKGLKVGVFTQVLSAEINGKKVEDFSTFQDEAADEFARQVSDNFERLSKVHPSFSRVQGLDELVALTKAIEEMSSGLAHPFGEDERPDLSWWLRDYQIKKVETPKEINVLEPIEGYKLPLANVVYNGHKELPDGVTLQAIALRLTSGDPMALKEAVLKTRPSPEDISWSFMIKEDRLFIASKVNVVPIQVANRPEEQKETYPSSVKRPSTPTTVDVELKTTPAVSPEERMKSYPSPGEYVAFSLKVAERMIKGLGEKQNFRTVYPEVYNLGGINQIHGLVYDRKEKDTIIVGRYNLERQPLTLDDFAVALRARFIHGKWPLVSIDPTEETKKTDMQIVRFEGGIEDTQFGQDLFDADYRLKRIGMGLLPPGIPIETYWDIGMEGAKQRTTGGSRNISSRFWFYPVLPNVLVREDVVAIKGLKVGVFTEVMSAEIDRKRIEDLSTFKDEAGDRFASLISDNFEGLGRAHPSFSRTQGMLELTSLSNAIENMDERPDIDWWLKDYQVKKIATEKEVKVLRRQEKYKVPGYYGEGYQEVSGGVQLMAIALRLNAGDVTALKEAVLKTRLKPDTLSWGFVVGEWLIPTTPGMLKMDDIAPLFAQAFFLQEQKRYDDSITLYGKIIELKPDWDWPYNNRGAAYHKKGEFDRAVSDYDRAIEINPRDAEAYNNRGAAYHKKGEFDRAISDYNKALEINPREAKAYYNRGVVCYSKGEYDRAIADYNKAIEINPRYIEAYVNRGVAYKSKGEYDRAISDYSKALEINPRDAEAYYNRGAAYHKKGEFDRAISDYNKALEINPRDAEAYYNRGLAYDSKGEYDRAILDFNKALEINPRYAEAYTNRGAAYQKKSEYDRAISDYNMAIEINPRYALAYVNRGSAYGSKGEYDRAIADFNKAIEINPRYAEAYVNRGSAYGSKGEYDRAIADYNKAIEINPGDAEAYNNRGLAYYYKGEYNKAWDDVHKAQELGYQVPPRLLELLRQATERQR